MIERQPTDDLIFSGMDWAFQGPTVNDVNIIEQLFRMYNERILIGGKLQDWTADGLVDYYLEDIYSNVSIYQQSGKVVELDQEASINIVPTGSLLSESQTTQIAGLKTGANLQDFRVYRHMQGWIERRCTEWRNPLTLEPFTGSQDLFNTAGIPQGWRRRTEPRREEYGKMVPGDLLGKWVVDDLQRTLSCFRYPVNNGLRDIYEDPFEGSQVQKTLLYRWFTAIGNEETETRYPYVFSFDFTTDENEFQLGFGVRQVTYPDTVEALMIGEPFFPYHLYPCKIEGSIRTRKEGHPLYEEALEQCPFTGLGFQVTDINLVTEGMQTLDSYQFPGISNPTQPAFPVPEITEVTNPEETGAFISVSHDATILRDTLVVPLFSVKGWLGDL